MLQEATTQLFGREEPVTNERLDEVFAQYDPQNEGKISKANILTYLQFLNASANTAE